MDTYQTLAAGWRCLRRRPRQRHAPGFLEHVSCGFCNLLLVLAAQGPVLDPGHIHYSPGDTIIRNSEFDGLLEVSSFRGHISTPTPTPPGKISNLLSCLLNCRGIVVGVEQIAGGPGPGPGPGNFFHPYPYSPAV